MDGDAGQGHGGYWNFRKRAGSGLPAVGFDGAEAFFGGAEKGFALGALFRAEAAFGEVIHAREGAEECWKGRGVVEVAALGQEFEQAPREAETRAAEGFWMLASGLPDAGFGLDHFLFQFHFRVEMQPGFVFEG